MYKDDENRNGLSIKALIIGLVLIIIFILLLIWLLPIPNSSKNDCNGDESCENLSTNRIFNANLEALKNAGLHYFKTDKLPKQINESSKITAQELNGIGLLQTLIDKNGESCDMNNSYVTVTKKSQEIYEVVDRLKCDDQEDSLTFNLGAYSYCSVFDLCEKQDIPKNRTTPTTPEKTAEPKDNKEYEPFCVLTVTEGERGTNEWYTGDVVVSFKSRTATTQGATIKEYGIGTSSTALFNNKDSYKVTENGITKIYGYVKDSNGKTSVCSLEVKKDVDNPYCELKVLSGSKGNNNNYVSDVVVGFNTKNDKTSGIFSFGISSGAEESLNNTSKYTITTNGTHTIYGFVKDYAGHTSKCEIKVVRSQEEAKVKTIPTCKLQVMEGTKGENNWYRSNVVLGFASRESTSGAEITAYGIGTEENYNGNENYTVTIDGSKTIYGYVKDSNGSTGVCSIVVKKDTEKPICTLQVTGGTYNTSGYYTSDVIVGFETKSDSVSGVNKYGIESKETFGANDSYTVRTVGLFTLHGYVTDAAGNEGTCQITVERRNNLEYQYQKAIDAQYSDWSKWTTGTYSPSNPPKFGYYALIQIEKLDKTRVIDYYVEKVGKEFYKYKPVKVGTIKQTYCSGYSYYRDKSTKETYAVKTGEKWKSVGKVTTDGWPTDSLAVKYEFVGFDYSCENCQTTPKKIWNKYTRTVSKVKSSDTIETSGITTKCSKTVTKEVEIFDVTKIFVGYEKYKEPVYKDVYTYRQRTRSLVKSAYIDYKWSSYNDKSLLNQGYTYTGNYRVTN